jgi:hypothetical protein
LIGEEYGSQLIFEFRKEWSGPKEFNMRQRREQRKAKRWGQKSLTTKHTKEGLNVETLRSAEERKWKRPMGALNSLGAKRTLNSVKRG